MYLLNLLATVFVCIKQTYCLQPVILDISCGWSLMSSLKIAIPRLISGTDISNTAATRVFVQYNPICLNAMYLLKMFRLNCKTKVFAYKQAAIRPSRLGPRKPSRLRPSFCLSKFKLTLLVL